MRIRVLLEHCFGVVIPQGEFLFFASFFLEALLFCLFSQSFFFFAPSILLFPGPFLCLPPFLLLTVDDQFVALAFGHKLNREIPTTASSSLISLLID